MFKFLDKIADWIPCRNEYYNAKIRRIKKRMDELVKKKSDTKCRLEYDRLAYELRACEEKVGDIRS